MWFIGAVIGALLFGAWWSDAWVVGALIGGVAGAWLSRKLGSARPGEQDRLLAAEHQLRLLSDEVGRMQRRLAALEQGRAAGEPPVAAPAAPEEAPGFAAAESSGTVPEAAAPVPGFASVEEGPSRPPEPSGMPEPPPAPAEWAYPPAAEPAGPPATPAAPSRIMEWLMGGNMVARIGVVILFFGVAFLLKYAYETFHLPIELRLAGVALGAAALLVVGWRLREKREGYALALQGGGVGLLYLTIFAAFRLYTLIPPLPAFALLFGVAALSDRKSVV